MHFSIQRQFAKVFLAKSQKNLLFILDSTKTIRLPALDFYAVIVDSGFARFIDYLTIRRRVRVVYERIVNEGEAWVDYSLIDNEGELSDCFSIHSIKLSKNSPETSLKREFTAIFFQVCFHFSQTFTITNRQRLSSQSECRICNRQCRVYTNTA